MKYMNRCRRIAAFEFPASRPPPSSPTLVWHDYFFAAIFPTLFKMGVRVGRPCALNGWKYPWGAVHQQVLMSSARGRYKGMAKRLFSTLYSNLDSHLVCGRESHWPPNIIFHTLNHWRSQIKSRNAWQTDMLSSSSLRHPVSIHF